jgi:hypothetical protein
VILYPKTHQSTKTYISEDSAYEYLWSLCLWRREPEGDGLMVPLPYLALIASMIIMLSATFYLMFRRGND